MGLCSGPTTPTARVLPGTASWTMRSATTTSVVSSPTSSMTPAVALLWPRYSAAVTHACAWGVGISPRVALHADNARLRPCTPQVTFRNPYHYRQDKELFIAAEGVYSGQVCHAEASAQHAWQRSTNHAQQQRQSTQRSQRHPDPQGCAELLPWCSH